MLSPEQLRHLKANYKTDTWISEKWLGYMIDMLESYGALDD